MEERGKAYSLDLGGYEVRYAFEDPDTYKIFGKYIREAEGSTYDIRVTREYMEKCRWLVTEDTEDDYLEFQSLMEATAIRLLSVNRALFHGVSFLWKGKAWIITAPSGTGKTTQYRHWRSMLRKEIQIISGDKSVITCRDDGKVIVSSSPWRGKERMGVPFKSRELGGIILLEQGNRNEIRRMSSQEAVYPLFIEFISIPENEEQIRKQGDLLRQILENTPVWKLVNKGDSDSALLTQKTLTDYLEEGHE
ncbi:MAG: hypothetical protein K6F23_15095 [Solobacterium sp.]|nr:hypothetical protein [Solobacterium sp.]